MPHSGVYPCHENQFSVGAVGASQLNSIKNCTTFSVAVNGTVEEWSPYDLEGWTARLMTGKNIVISVTAKRTFGDTGNDFIADCAFAVGHTADAQFSWNFPDGTVVSFAAVVNVKSMGGGDATNVAPLEFDVMSNGKPTITLPSNG